MQDLEYIFNPRSIAVVGASRNPEKQGYRYVEILREFGFEGKIYPVNPKASEILGLKSYPKIGDIAGSVDYVISTIPASGLPKLIEECSTKRVKAIQLYTGRLAETGEEESIRLEEEIAHAAQKNKIRLIGPNCMGIYHPKEGISFSANFPKEGGFVAFLSQSAGHTFEVVYRGGVRGLRFSKVISYGNASDLNEVDFIRYLAHDPETKIISVYIEGVRDTKHFPHVLQEAARMKPTVILKGGRTDAGSRAVSSHTASLAGSRAIWDALCRQAGVIHADTVEEMVDILVTLSFLSPLKGRRVGVAGAGGGGSVAMADECENNGLTVPPLPSDIVAELKRLFPHEGNLIKNPIDLSVTAEGAGIMLEALLYAMELIAKHPEFDLLICDTAVERVLESIEWQGMFQGIVAMFIQIGKESKKPMAVVMRSADSPEEWRWKSIVTEQERCIQAGFPIYPTIARAAKAISEVVKYNLSNATRRLGGKKK